MRSFDPAPTSLKAVMTPEWLSAMLSRCWPGAQVRNVETVELLVTMATKVRLSLEVDGADGAPTAICIKGILTKTEARATSSIVETLFYRDLADNLPVRVPERVHADLNADGSNGVLVMRDVVAAGGRFCSALKSFTPAEARDGLDQLARLHAAGAQGTAAFNMPWISRFLERVATTPLIPREMLQGLLDGERGAPLPASLRSAERLERAVVLLAGQVRKRPNCLVHGDAHAGNIYRSGNGELGLVDWQVLQKGEWAQDVAYHLAAVLTPEDRRTHERALLDHYLDQLASCGGPVIARELAWNRYRAGMIYGYYLWSVTRKVAPELTNEFVKRLGLAVHDLDSYAVVA